MTVPSLVDSLVDSPQISECYAVIRALEFQTANKRSLVNKLSNKELDLVKDTNVAILVLDLEIAAAFCSILQIYHVFTIN